MYKRKEPKQQEPAIVGSSKRAKTGSKNFENASNASTSNASTIEGMHNIKF
jgi:hypothetical protein